MRTVRFLLACSLTACSTPAPTIDAGAPDDAAPTDTPTSSDAPVATDAPPPIDAPASVDAGGDDADPACVPTGLGPSRELVVLYDEIFATHDCARCHDGSEGSLDLTSAADALATLVGFEGCHGVRVVPCRPEESYLAWVIRNGDGICAGRRHSFFTQLTAEEADRVDAWIASGAH